MKTQNKNKFDHPFLQLELCAESHKAVQVAKHFGLNRIELCSGLTVGGLTPSPGLVFGCSKPGRVDIHTMIRLREGNFNYSAQEINIMFQDIHAMHRSGAKGVVFGCLNKHQEIDVKACSKLVDIARQLELEITFHRAFDFCKDPFKALEALIDLGFDRILTSGQKKTAEEGIELIRQLVDQAAGRIQIMAGSGVNKHNAGNLADTGLNALHFTAYKIGIDTDLGMGATRKMDKKKIKNIIHSLNEWNGKTEKSTGLSES